MRDSDAVAIFTQRWLHGEMATCALEAGKPVYSTVPMAIEVDQIVRIVELVKDAITSTTWTSASNPRTR